MSYTTQLWNAVERRRNFYVNLLQNLVRVAQGGETTTQAVVADALAELGCRIDQFTFYPQQLKIDYEYVDPAQRDPAQRLCVVGHWQGQREGRSLLFFAHPDGEPVAGTDKWRHDPFAGEIENGRLYGWGVADDLLGVATMIAALDATLAAGLKPAGDVFLASTPSKKRSQGIVAVLDRGYPADGAVYLHPAESGGGLDEIKAITSGMLHFRITVEGQLPDTNEPGHTVFAHRAVNPIDKAWFLYQTLQALNEQRGQDVHYTALDEAIGRSTNILVSFIQAGEASRLSRVSQSCVLAGTISFPPGEVLSAVQAQVAATLEQAAAQDEWLNQHPPRLEWLAGVGSAAVAPEHPLFQSVRQAIVGVTGRAHCS